MQLSTSQFFVFCIVTVILLVVWCEYLVYFWVIAQCRWPNLVKSDAFNKNTSVARVMILTDVHIFDENSFFVDRFKREWQMYRSFQTAIHHLEPDAVFILGNLITFSFY